MIFELCGKFRPASDDEISKALLSMNCSGAAVPVGMDLKTAMPVYAIALEDAPAVSLASVAKKFFTGSLPDVNYQFLPRPPELAILCRKETSVMIAELQRLLACRDELAELAKLPASEKTVNQRIRQMIKPQHRILIK
jgi:hypothetical protein